MERNIPGTINIVGREFCYIEDDGKDKFEEELFDKVTSPYEFTNAKDGGIISENCKLWIPTNELFHGLSYKGDVDGWRKDIFDGAKKLNLLIGNINGENIELSDGRIYPLTKCKVEFY